MIEIEPARAVHRILSALEASLRDGRPLPSGYAGFCADCFERFVNSRKAWSATATQPSAEEAFSLLDRSKESPLDRLLGTGERLPEARLRTIGHAFCVASGLVRHRRKPPMLYPAITSGGKSPSESFVSISRETGYSAVAEEGVHEAEGGDPSLLRQILGALVQALRGSQAIPCPFSAFCADALRTLLDDAEAWEAIGRERASTEDQRIFGRAFCRAFRLSKSQATLREGEIPEHHATCPPAVLKFEELLLYGISRRAATSIVLTAFRKPRRRSLEDWLRFLKIRSVKSGTLGDHSLIDHRLAIAAEVERARTRHRSLKHAYLEVARSLACKLFPDFRSQMVRWAKGLLHDAQRRRRAPDQVELARQVIAAVEQHSPFPRVPAELAQRIVPRIRAEKATTRLPESAVRELLPAVRKAHRFARSL